MNTYFKRMQQFKFNFRIMTILNFLFKCLTRLISNLTGGEDASSFSLMRRPGSEKAEIISNTELDYESAKKKYDVIVRAASPPLRSDVHVEIVVTDVNDNAPRLQDFQVHILMCMTLSYIIKTYIKVHTYLCICILWGAGAVSMAC